MDPRDYRKLVPLHYLGGNIPAPKQARWLGSTARVSLFGGAARCGKTYAALMRGLQYADVPGYACLIIRKTYKDLSLPRGLILTAQAWLSSTGAKWSGEQHSWTFPSGAILQFGHLESAGAVYRYQGASFQRIIVDELAQHPESDWQYLGSRLTQPIGRNFPLDKLATTNPPSFSQRHRHGEWVKRSFVDGATRGTREYIEARIEDNLHEDRAAYELSLHDADPVTRAQLLYGDWDIQGSGNFFKREWFRPVSALPPVCAWARGWDLAASDGPTSDWTVGVKMGRTHDGWAIAHVVRVRADSAARDRIIASTVANDGRGVKQIFEQEGGSGGKAQVATIRANLLGSWTAAERPTGSKASRAGPFASAAGQGRVSILAAPWTEAYLDELCLFSEDTRDYEHDDQVDASSLAFGALSGAVSTGPIDAPRRREEDDRDAPPPTNAASFFSGLKPN